MTTAEAAKHFNVSERTIRRWIQTGKLKASRSNGRWAVRTDIRSSECPNDREDDRLTEGLQSEIQNLPCGWSAERFKAFPALNPSADEPNTKTQLERADFEIAHLTERVEEKTDQIQHLRDQLARRDDTIESLTREIDHLTQVVAMSQKNIATLTDQLDAMKQLEDLRQRPWWQRLFGRKIANSPTS